MAARSPARTRAGPGRDAKAGAHLVGHDARQRGLPQARRPGEQQMIRGLAPPPGRLEHDLEMLLELGLADELAQPAGPQGDLFGGFHRIGRGRDRAIQALLSHAGHPAAARATGGRGARWS